MEEREHKTYEQVKRTKWQKFKRMVTKNNRNQGITCLIVGALGIYLTTILFFLCGSSCRGLKLALMIPTILLVIVGTIATIIVGLSKLGDYYDWD